MKIYDCFPFNGELNLLKLRLELYKNLVDYHVIVESKVNFRGVEKDLKMPQEILKHNPNIRYIVLKKEDFKINDPWHREYETRNSFLKGLHDSNNDDLIIISDIDEIISPSKFEAKHNGVVLYEMAFNRFNINYQCLNLNWIETCSFPAKFLKTFSPIEMRLVYKTWKKRYNGDFKKGSRKFKILDSVKFIRNSGSHFSYVPINKKDSFYKAIKNKIKMFPKDHYLSRQASFDVNHLYFKFLFFFGLDIFGLPQIWGKVLKPIAQFDKKEQRIIKKYLTSKNIFTFLAFYNSKLIVGFARLLEYQIWKVTNFLVRVYANLIKKILNIFL